MSTATITRVTPDTRRASPETRRPVRPESSGGPLARPARNVPAPVLPTARHVEARSCRVEASAAQGGWRLTERGIAVVFVLVAMIAVAAVAVIGLTAWQVTGADYATWSSASLRGR